MAPRAAEVSSLDTRPIEHLIAEACADAGCERELQDRQGIVAAPDDLERGARFVLAYIEQVPYMMKVASTAASNVGLEKPMQRILEMAKSYWVEGDDVIPDDLGVIGLLDDAYCSLTSLQAVSDHYRLQTGKHLFPDDLSEANRALRQVIGEPYVSELDRIVIRTMKETGLLEAVTALAHQEKRLSLESNSTIWNHGPAGRVDLGSLARLGIRDEPT
jgi:uncharacterized membrane protein YkvA (DUF1232 family)